MANTKNLWSTVYKNVRKKHPDWSHKRVYLATSAIMEKRQNTFKNTLAEAAKALIET